MASQPPADACITTPLQEALVRYLAEHPLLAGTPVLARKKHQTLLDLEEELLGAKRCVLVYPPLLSAFNPNLVLWCDDIEIRLQVSEDPKLNEGEVDAYSLVERVHRRVLAGPQLVVAGYQFNNLVPDKAATRPVAHPDRVAFELVYHTSGGLADPSAG